MTFTEESIRGSKHKNKAHGQVSCIRFELGDACSRRSSSTATLRKPEWPTNNELQWRLVISL